MTVTAPHAAQLPREQKTDGAGAPRHTVLAEPVKIAEFWKNRRGESVRVELRTYEGHHLIDVRQCFTNKEGKLQPTSKGLCLAVRRLPDLLAAIQKATATARELGLIEASAEP